MAAGKKDEKPKDEDPEAAAAELQEKKKKKKLILMIGLGVLLLMLLLGGTVFVTVKLLVPKNTASAEHDASESTESSEAAKGDEKPEPTLPPIYFTLKPNFTVNYDVAGKQHFLQCELTFLYREEKMEKFLELHMPALRNGLVMLLSNQVFEELQTVEGKEKLRIAALKTVQDIISKEHALLAAKDKEKDKDKEKGKKKAEDNVEQILFTHFVMQ